MGKRKLKDEIAGLRAEIADLRVLVYDLKDDLAALRGRVEALEERAGWGPIRVTWSGPVQGTGLVYPETVWREQWRHIGNSINDATRPDGDA